MYWWSELRPDDDGRIVVCSHNTHTHTTTHTPAPYNARTRVHEYGGAAFTVVSNDDDDDVIIYFTNYSDQNVYAQVASTNTVRRVTTGGVRHACLTATDGGRQLVAVAQTDTDVNSIVVIDVSTGVSRTVCEGRDFYLDIVVNRAHTRLAWMEYDHLNMPWQSTRLMMGAFDPTAAVVVTDVVVVAGGDGQTSVVTPTFVGDDDELVYVCDRTNWYNLYSTTRGGDDGVSLYRAEAEFAGPAWVFGRNRWYTVLRNGAVVATFGAHAVLIPAAGDDDATVRQVELGGDAGYCNLVACDGDGDACMMIREHTTRPSDVILVTVDDGGGGGTEIRVLAVAQRCDDIPLEWISVPQHITFPVHDRTVHAQYYKPPSPSSSSSSSSPPPLLVFSHGGPTGQASTAFNARLQYWTSRGFAVVDVDYSGSSGYGRAYRNLLLGQWGVYDHQDCAGAARHLVAAGLAAADKVAIRGGSAGGYTTLCALTFTDDHVFACGCSHYGVADLTLLGNETHKFESHYLDRLVDRCAYAERSPLQQCGARLRVPVLFLQGDEDRVVPSNQAELMYNALKVNGVEGAELHVYAGEQHGFRKAHNVRDALERELAFYRRVMMV